MKVLHASPQNTSLDLPIWDTGDDGSGNCSAGGSSGHARVSHRGEAVSSCLVAGIVSSFPRFFYHWFLDISARPTRSDSKLPSAKIPSHEVFRDRFYASPFQPTSLDKKYPRDLLVYSQPALALDFGAFLWLRTPGHCMAPDADCVWDSNRLWGVKGVHYCPTGLLLT